MLCRVTEMGELRKIQLSEHTECALFSQEIVDGSIHVRYHTPPASTGGGDGEDANAAAVTTSPDPEVLQVPLDPDLGQLVKADVNLHQSMVSAYRMGSPYDQWFSACFGFDTALLYIGDGRRPVLGTFSPKSANTKRAPTSKGWLSSVSSFLGGDTGAEHDEPDWLTFSDCAPFLIATEASLANVSRRLESGDMEMAKFRPNIVIDGEGEWEEDFWTELAVQSRGDADGNALVFALTKMCNRCTSINVDYTTGKTATGEHGVILKKLMSDRRVDAGYKYAPVFGRYAFLKGDQDESHTSLAVGDAVEVSGRSEERSVWDWPMNNKTEARFYGQPV